MLVSLFIARRINTQLGGAFVAPWEIGQFSDEWLDLFFALEQQLPAMRKGIDKIEAMKAKIRSDHPTFGKRH